MSVRRTTNGAIANTTPPNNTKRLNDILEVGMRRKSLSPSTSPSPSPSHKKTKSKDTMYANTYNDNLNILLRTSDGYNFYVNTILTLEMGFIQGMTMNTNLDKEVAISVAKVNEQSMKSILWFASKCEEAFPGADFERDYQQHKLFRTNLVAAITQNYASDTDKDEKIFELMLAANFLEYKPLLDACANSVAGTIKGMTTEEIQHRFMIKNNDKRKAADIEKTNRENPLYNIPN